MSKSQTLILIFLSLLFIWRLQTADLTLARQPEIVNSLISSFSPLRQKLIETINLILPDTQASLLSGILLGNSALPKELKTALVDTSTIHIAVVSGQNLSMLAGFILSLAPLLGRKKVTVISLLICLFYSFLTGFQIPVIRAMLMFGASAIAKLLNREINSFWVLMSVGLLMLVYQPAWIFSISFQLSFMATLAVIVVSPILIQRLSFLPDIIKQDLGVSISTQLLTLPIIALDFHRISLIGSLVNIFVLWTVPIIMIVGAVALVVGLVSLTVGAIVAVSASVFLTYFIYIVNFFANFSFGSITIGNLSGIFWIGYYLFLAGVFLKLC